MKRLTIAALLAGQVLAAQPAIAAGFAETRAQQAGAFAGFRLRMPLDGDTRERRMRASLSLAPTLHSRSAQGASQLRFGEGVELGLRDSEPVRLSIAGAPVSQLAQGPRGPDGERLGVSTLGWVGIGVGVVAVALGVGYLVLEEAIDCDADEECN